MGVISSTGRINSCSCGPPAPINDRIKLKLLVSAEIKKRRGLGTRQNAVERSLERHTINHAP